MRLQVYDIFEKKTKNTCINDSVQITVSYSHNNIRFLKHRHLYVKYSYFCIL